MIPGQICDLQLAEDFRQLDLDNTLLFPCSCYNVDVRLNVAQEVPWHWHEEIEVIAIAQGRGLVQAGGSSWLLEAGDGIFVNSNTLHSVHLVDGGLCGLHSLVFSADLLAGVPGSVFEQRYLRPVLRSPTQALPLQRNVPWQREAVSAIEAAYQAYAAESFGWELLVRAELSRLWTLAAEHAASSVPAVEESADTRRLKEMLCCLHEHYDRPISLEEVAAAAKVGKRECLRCFQRTIGVTPIQYLLRYRVRQASRLLVETDLPVTEIALRCGFESPSYFSLTFRRLTGRTPRDYRRCFAGHPAEERQDGQA